MSARERFSEAGVTLSPILGDHEGKWVALVPGSGRIVAVADTLSRLIGTAAEQNVVFHRVFPRDVSIIFNSV